MKNKYVDGLVRITNYDDRSGFVRLDMNENPYGLPESFCSSILKEVTPEFLSTYPNCHDFIEAYSKYIGMGFGNVLPVNGSDMGIRLIYDSYVTPGSKVVGVFPSFEMYRIYSEMRGANFTAVRYNDDLTFDIESLISEIDEKTALVSLLNPNNPVGDVFSESDVRRIIETAKRYDAIVLIDEAYHYFNETSFLDLIKTYDNVIILRTFSKIFSMAALRLGVIISDESVIQTIFKAQPSFDVNSIALLFGKRIIESPELINQLVSQFRECKDFAEKWLTDNGYEFIHSRTNFILIKLKCVTPESLKQALFEKKILIKTYGDHLLSGYFRINMASVDVLSDFFGKLQEIDR